MKDLNQIRTEILECKPIADTISNYLISAYAISQDEASSIWDTLIKERCDLNKKESLLKYVGRICYRLVFNMRFDEALSLICKNQQRLDLMFKAYSYSTQENYGNGLYHISSRLIYGCLLLDDIPLGVSIMERYIKVIRDTSEDNYTFQYICTKDLIKLTSLLEARGHIDDYNSHVENPRLSDKTLSKWYAELSRSEDEVVKEFGDMHSSKKQLTQDSEEKFEKIKIMENKDIMFVFPEVDLELAKLTEEVARELDPFASTISVSINIDMSSLIEEFVDKELSGKDENVRLEIKKQLLEKQKQEAEAEELEKKKRESLKEKIKVALGHNAAACYKKAYELCGDIDNHDSNKIRYEVYSHIKGISSKEQIAICTKYLDYLNDPDSENYELRSSERAQVLEKIEKIQSKQLAEYM